MKVSDKYNNEDFLNVMDIGIPMITGRISQLVGCSRDTTMRFLTKLERLGYVKRVQLGSTRPHGDYFSWLKVPDNEEVDKLFIQMVNTFEEEHGECDLARLVKAIINKNCELEDNVIALIDYLEVR